MNKFSFLLLFLLFFVNEATSQTNVKPLFKLLESASYEKTKTGILSLTDYLKVDSNGKVEIAEINRSDTSYYSFNLPESVITKLNVIYGGPKTLKSYMVKEKLADGMNYAGDYSFVILRGADNKIEHLTYIYPFMEPVFHEGGQAIYSFYFREKQKLKIKKFKISESFVKDLHHYHRLAKNLPEKVLPPAEMPPPGK